MIPESGLHTGPQCNLTTRLPGLYDLRTLMFEFPADFRKQRCLPNARLGSCVLPLRTILGISGRVRLRRIFHISANLRTFEPHAHEVCQKAGEGSYEGLPTIPEIASTPGILVPKTQISDLISPCNVATNSIGILRLRNNIGLFWLADYARCGFDIINSTQN